MTSSLSSITMSAIALTIAHSASNSTPSTNHSPPRIPAPSSGSMEECPATPPEIFMEDGRGVAWSPDSPHSGIMHVRPSSDGDPQPGSDRRDGAEVPPEPYLEGQTRATAQPLSSLPYGDENMSRVIARGPVDRRVDPSRNGPNCSSLCIIPACARNPCSCLCCLCMGKCVLSTGDCFRFTLKTLLKKCHDKDVIDGKKVAVAGSICCCACGL